MKLLIREMIFVKILQVNNTGVVPYTITQYLRKEGYDVDIVIPMHSFLDVQFQKGLDNVIELDSDPLILRKWLEKHIDNYDIIHLHALFQHLAFMRILAPSTSIIYTGHGREVIKGWHPMIKQYADKVTCVTENLMVEGVEWIPNAPDPDHWQRKREPIPKKALIKFLGGIVDDNRAHKEALEVCVKIGSSLDIQDRSKRMYSYITYPRFLEIYETFFDYKYLRTGIGYDELKLPLSYTALQFLQMGGIVYHHSGIYDELPKNINYDKIMKRWRDIYDELAK